MSDSALSRRADPSISLAESWRNPVQLTVTPPLVALVGLLAVVAAAMVGGSTRLVAMVAAGALGFSAAAPVAMMEAFVNRPLRAATARLRAARDGKTLPDQAAFAFGMVADLVHVAEDIRAARAAAGKQLAALAQHEKLLVAGDEAIRAYRQQTEALASAADAAPRRGAAAPAELAEALKALRAAPSVTQLEAAFERLESMFVYIAESLDRREGGEKKAEDGSGRVERYFDELAQLAARNSEAAQSALAGVVRTLRADAAATAAEDKALRARLLERIETAEARVLAKLFEPSPLEAARLVEVIRAEAETTRRAMKERLERGARTGGPESEAIAQLVERLSLRLEAVDHLADAALPATQAALQEAAAKFDTLAGEVADRTQAAVAQEIAEALVRLAAHRRGEFDPAVAALQAVTQEFSKAGAQLSAGAEALKAAAADRAPVAA